MTLPQKLSDGKGNHELQLSEVPASSAAPGRPSLSLKDVAVMIYRRRWLALVLFSAIFFIVVAATMMQASIYLTRAKLLFKKERINTVISASDGAATEDKSLLSEEALNSEIEILKSTPLLRDVLRNDMAYKKIIGDERASALDSTEGLELAVAMFRVDMDCQIVPKSNILQVTYESKDPRLAADVINELCRRYVIRHLEVHDSPGIYAFFQKQAEVLRDTLQVMAAALERFEAANNLVAPEQQRQLYLQKLTDYEVQLSSLRANAHASAEQVGFLEKQLVAEPARMQVQNQQVSSAVTDGLTKQLTTLKAKYAEMVAGEQNKAEPKGQVARSLKGRIAQIEETIQQQQREQQPEVTVDINHSLMDLSTELTRARFDLIGYQTKEKEIKTAAAELRQQIKDLERASFTHEAMQNQLQLLQSNYVLYAKKQEEARISTALDREQVANVSLIDPAIVPLDPVSPNRKLNIAVGFFLALLVSVGITFGLGFLDGVVHTSADIARQLELPIVVSIPDGEWPPNLLPETVFETAGLPAGSK